MAADKAQLGSFKETQNPKAEQMPHSLQETLFYYNLIMLTVKQRPYSTKSHSTHTSHAVPSAKGSQVHPKGIPPRREADLCKGHCVNHHALSLAAAVANCP